MGYDVFAVFEGLERVSLGERGGGEGDVTTLVSAELCLSHTPLLLPPAFSPTPWPPRGSGNKNG